MPRDPRTADVRLSARLRPALAVGAAVVLGFPLLLHPAQAQERTVTIVLSEEPELLDPCNASRSTVGRVVKQNISETLTEVDPKDGSVTPRLASSWQRVDDFTWRFKIRPGVRFHDGTPFDAKAAADSINRTMGTTLDCETRTKFFGGVKLTPRAVDTLTLEIKTDKALPILPTNMGTMALYKPKTERNVYDRSPIGTGPYRFTRWTVGQEIILDRFDGYWGRKPEVQRARYIWRIEGSVRAAMVVTGEADISPNITQQDANRPELDFSYPNAETTRLRLDVSQPPLNDRRVRLAMNYAVDRNALKGTVFSKDVIPASQYIFPSINGHNPDIKPFPYDPEKARQLLAEARRDGVPVDNTIYLTGRTNIYPEATEAMQALQAMFNAVGLKTELTMLEVSTWLKYNRKPFATPRKPIVIQNMHDNDKGDAAFTAYSNYHSKGAVSVLSDERLDALIEKAQVTSGPERRRLWQQMFKRVNEEIVAEVILFHMVGYSRVGKRVKYQPSISTNSEIHIEDISFK
ncbi:MAG: peptide ABC transporter substrate-binding protein [Candidatus Lambdaproteobacteria bacterium]|nr:peptide ABC transporter substrate-binding protein [Candidatus Lambdaproteobacteria bacterium]